MKSSELHSHYNWTVVSPKLEMNASPLTSLPPLPVIPPLIPNPFIQSPKEEIEHSQTEPIKVEIKCLAHRKKNLRVSPARFEKDQGAEFLSRPPRGFASAFNGEVSLALPPQPF